MRISFLGTAGASVTADRDNTFFHVASRDRSILIDCAGNPAGKLLQLGIDPLRLDIVCLTHLHIDHCYGLPTLLFHMFLNGRIRPLTITAPDEDFSTLEAILTAYGIYPSVRSFDLDIVRVPKSESAAVWTDGPIEITASPADHSRPARGYRILDTDRDVSVVYSGDTRPAPGIIDLAAGTDCLIHESTYTSVHTDKAVKFGHSTAAQAAEIAATAHAGRLVMVHFDMDQGFSVQEFEAEAKTRYSGQIIVPQDMQYITI